MGSLPLSGHNNKEQVPAYGITEKLRQEVHGLIASLPNLWSSLLAWTSSFLRRPLPLPLRSLSFPLPQLKGACPAEKGRSCGSPVLKMTLPHLQMIYMRPTFVLILIELTLSRDVGWWKGVRFWEEARAIHWLPCICNQHLRLYAHLHMTGTVSSLLSVAKKHFSHPLMGSVGLYEPHENSPRQRVQ